MLNNTQQKAFNYITNPLVEDNYKAAQLFQRLNFNQVMEIFITLALPHWEAVQKLEDEKAIVIEVIFPQFYRVEVRLYLDKEENERFIEIKFAQHPVEHPIVRYTDRGQGFKYRSTFIKGRLSPKSMVKILLEG